MQTRNARPYMCFNFCNPVGATIGRPLRTAAQLSFLFYRIGTIARERILCAVAALAPAGSLSHGCAVPAPSRREPHRIRFLYKSATLIIESSGFSWLPLEGAGCRGRLREFSSAMIAEIHWYAKYSLRTSVFLRISPPEASSVFHIFLIDIRRIYHYNKNIICFLFLCV